MSLEEKFNAAVNVIRSLPKSAITPHLLARGSYQPSNELMLRFYSYYKQATEGPCNKAKPGFWDVVGRAKWESWDKLGNMSKDAAMQAYVDELHKIVETMSYNSDVASFLSAEDDDDLKLVAGDVLAQKGDTPRESVTASRSSTPAARRDSDDEFSDPIDDPQMDSPVLPPVVTRSQLSNGHAHQITSQLTHLKVLEQLPGTLARLEADVAALRKAVEGDRNRIQHSGWLWPWQELSTPTLVFLVVWPFIAFRIMNRNKRRT